MRLLVLYVLPLAHLALGMLSAKSRFPDNIDKPIHTLLARVNNLLIRSIAYAKSEANSYDINIPSMHFLCTLCYVNKATVST